MRWIEREIDVEEFRYWLAYHRFVCPIGDENRWAAVTATAALAPWSQKAPEVDRVLGLERLPMTAEEIAAELAKLKR